MGKLNGEPEPVKTNAIESPDGDTRGRWMSEQELDELIGIAQYALGATLAARKRLSELDDASAELAQTIKRLRDTLTPQPMPKRHQVL